jgi:hypothetical protein
LSASAWSCSAWSGSLGPAEHASEPGQDLLLLQPLAPGRILGSADVLDHREIAQT